MPKTTVDRFLQKELVVPAGQPLRVAVYGRIAEGIRSSVFPLGSPLPRDSELAQELGVSRAVVREALILMEEDRLIVTKRGVGRFVATSFPRVGLEGFRPFEKVLTDGNLPVTVRPVAWHLERATDFALERLALDKAANMWWRESVIELDDEPVALVQEQMRAGRYLSDVSPELDANLEAAASGPATLLAGLIQRCGQVFSSGACEISAAVAGETRAKLLGLKAMDPVLIFVQLAEFEGTPVYLAKCIITSRIGHLSLVQSG
ncbi:GntR family transcriptional regulator [Streptomyces sp. NPDC004752]